MSPGDLVYYDKCGGNAPTVFPFAEKSAIGIGIIITDVCSFKYNDEDIHWVWILDESGKKLEYSLDYLEPVIT